MRGDFEVDKGGYPMAAMPTSDKGRSNVMDMRVLNKLLDNEVVPTPIAVQVAAYLNRALREQEVNNDFVSLNGAALARYAAIKGLYDAEGNLLAEAGTGGPTADNHTQNTAADDEPTLASGELSGEQLPSDAGSEQATPAVAESSSPVSTPESAPSEESRAASASGIAVQVQAPAGLSFPTIPTLEQLG